MRSVSNHLVLAAVTTVLKHRLEQGAVAHNLAATLGREVTVSTLPPDRIPMGPSEAAQLNLLFYRIAPELTLRSLEGPVGNVPGYELHYLLTAYGGQELDAELLLGFAIQLFHDTPMLTHDDIQVVLAPDPEEVGVGDTIEQLTITFESLTTEQMGSLWSALQARYRPSVAYRVLVALINTHP
jgi:hypothetical protein